MSRTRNPLNTDTHEGSEDTIQSDVGLVHPVRPHLFLVLECERPIAGGARFDLSHLDEVVIGRGTDRVITCVGRRLTVQVPSRCMSVCHARIRRTGAGWVLEDAGSTNGCWINGAKVTSSVLADNDCVQLGHTLFAIRTAISTPRDCPEVLDPIAQPPQALGLGTLLPSLADGFARLAKVARSELPISLSGNTGTGKEVIARAIHELSGRSGNWVALNCSAITDGLAETQMFGHVRGAFSGAIRDEIGFFRAADHGTLFLDELGDLPPRVQGALLRALQENEVTPVGSSRAIKFDTRIVAASHQPLTALVEQNRFRKDLSARLHGQLVELPDLVHRREDLGILIADILTKLGARSARIHPAVARRLWWHDWPLNIRELEQVLKRALVLAESDRAIQLEHLPASICSGSTVASSADHSQESSPPRSPSRSMSEDDLRQREQLVEWLSQHEGNVSRVARSTGKARVQIQRWMRRFGLDASAYRKRS